MVTLQDFIYRLGSYNHLNVSITDSGSERVKAIDGTSKSSYKWVILTDNVFLVRALCLLGTVYSKRGEGLGEIEIGYTAVLLTLSNLCSNNHSIECNVEL